MGRRKIKLLVKRSIEYRRCRIYRAKTFITKRPTVRIMIKISYNYKFDGIANSTTLFNRPRSYAEESYARMYYTILDIKDERSSSSKKI